MGWTWSDYIQTPAPVIEHLIGRFKAEAQKAKSAVPRMARRRMR